MIVLTQTPDGSCTARTAYNSPALPYLLARRYGDSRYTIRPAVPTPETAE